MTEQEKLVELIDHVCEGHVENLMRPGGVEALADHLIAHGVTVRKMQKPLTVDELIFFNWEIWREWWIELISGRLLCAKECKGYIHIPKVDYGKAWRCWAEKPTEEERWAAKWE